MRLEVYDDAVLLFHSEEKDIMLVQHMIENLFFVKKVIRRKLDLSLYQMLANHPHRNLANVMEVSYSHEKTIVIEEFVNGCTLEYKLSQRKFTLSEFYHIMKQLFDVITHLHTLPIPIIHRDIKPDNILIDKQQVYLIDFEIAKLMKNRQDILRTGSVGYAAPEQYHGMSDQRSDIYSMGILLHELWTHTEKEADCGCDLQAIIVKSTALDAAKRYQSITEMRVAFFNRMVNLQKR